MSQSEFQIIPHRWRWIPAFLWLVGGIGCLWLWPWFRSTGESDFMFDSVFLSLTFGCWVAGLIRWQVWKHQIVPKAWRWSSLILLAIAGLVIIFGWERLFQQNVWFQVVFWFMFANMVVQLARFILHGLFLLYVASFFSLFYALFFINGMLPVSSPSGNIAAWFQDFWPVFSTILFVVLNSFGWGYRGASTSNPRSML